MHLTRRGVLAGAAALTALATTEVTRAPRAAAAPAGGTLIHVFLYGGLDGLSLIAPAGDPVLAAARPNLLLGDDSLPLARGFLLTSAFAPLKKYLDGGHLAFLPGVADPRLSRSHFQAQDACHLGGLPGETGGRGWLDTLVDLLGPGTAFRSVGVGPTMPRSLVGRNNAVGLSSVAGLKLNGEQRYADPTLDALRGMFTGIDHPLGRSVVGGLDAVLAAPRLATPAAPPGTGIAGALTQVARLLKGGARVRVAAVGMDGFDTHENQGTGPGGYLYGLLNELARALAAFFDDLGPLAAEVTVVVSSEFGRRVAENGRGTDHGYGGAVALLSGKKLAGSLLGNWLGLNETDNGDVPEYNNVFDVFGSAAQGRFGLTNAEVQRMFPRRIYNPIELYA